MNDKLNTDDPQAVASRYGLPANNGTYHLLAVLRALEEGKTHALIAKSADSCKHEYETVIQIEGLATQEMLASFGLRYGFFVLLLASIYEEGSPPDAEIHKPHIEAIKDIIFRGARNLSQLYLERVEEGGNG